jgi:hypothetical protein
VTSAADFLQIHTVKSSVFGPLVTGAEDEVYLAANATQVSTQHGDVTGSLSGTQVSIDLLWSSGNQTGTLTPESLLLDVAESDGTLATIVYRHATVADYNRAVADIQVVGQAAQAAAQVASQAAAAAAPSCATYQIWWQRCTWPDGFQEVCGENTISSPTVGSVAFEQREEQQARAAAQQSAQQAQQAAQAQAELQQDEQVVIGWCQSHGAPWANAQTTYDDKAGVVTCQDNGKHGQMFGPGTFINLPYPAQWTYYG